MPIDVLVWGATGYTGKLVAEYLLRRYGVGKSLAWGIAGRSRAKLEAVRVSLEAIDPQAHELPLFLGDSGDRDSLEALARAAKVVASIVGPYAVHGAGLVAACVEAGVGYCDITGETPFMRAMIDAHHARARETGARIVHACGFDSVPADLGTLMLQTYARERHGMRCSLVKLFGGEAKGGISGGTAASLLKVAEDVARDPRVARVLADPYALDPEYDGPRDGEREQRGAVWDADIGRWTGPYPFAVVDTRVVRRTNALLGYSWGKDFHFLEATAFRAGPAGWALAVLASVAVTLGMAAVTVTPFRKELAQLLPAPGEGPSAEARAGGYFASRLVGVLDDNEDGKRVYGLVRGDSDPGYGETAKMLAESAVCLATDGDAIRKEGGVLTPGACMGMKLVERLRAAGMRFEAGETPPL